MSEKSGVRHVQDTVEADAAYEIPSYQTCLNLVRKHGPAIREQLHGQPDFGEKYKAALVAKAFETFRKVRR